MLKVLLAIALLSCASPTLAAEDPNDPNAALTEVVTIAPRDAKSDDCALIATADFAKFTDKLPIFREGFLNRDQSIDFYNQRRKQVFSYIILKRAAELMTEALYNAGHTEQECKFSISVAYNDKFGQDRTFEAVTWRFNAEQAAKVNWEKFDPRNFMDVALDYKLSPKISEWVSDEPSMAGNDLPPAQPVCDMFMFNANIAFVRSTTFCKKDFMDMPEALVALAAARKCTMPKADFMAKGESIMKQVDRIARENGRSAVCRFAEGLVSEIRSRTR